MNCNDWRAQVYDLCIAGGRDPVECEKEANRAYERCLLAEVAFSRVDAVLQSLAAKKAMEYVDCIHKGGSIEECMGIFEVEVPVPFPPMCGTRSLEVRGQIFDDPKKAMIFSDSLAEAFSKAGIELKDDETFSCLVCVTKRPKYVSEILDSEAFDPGTQARPRIQYIMEPAIMRRVMEKLEEDKIDYKTSS